MEAREIVAALTAAYGGRSQWGPIEVGLAVYGQSNNNGLKNPEECIKEIHSLITTEWGNDPSSYSEEFLRVALATFAGAGDERMATHKAWVAKQINKGYAAY